MKSIQALLLAIAALVGVLLFLQALEIRRYLKLRSM